MGFDSNYFLSWYLPRIRQGGGQIDLHSSGFRWVGIEEIEMPCYCSTNVTGRFEAAIAEWLGFCADEIVYAHGATGGTLIALLTLVESGKEIIAERPIYEPLLRQAERLGSVQRLERSMDQNWTIPIDRARAIVSKRTGAVMITEPNNPSGALAPREQVMELAALAEKYGAYLIINEVYRGFSGTPSYHRAAKNIVVVSSLSKLMGAYWARAGWFSAAPEIAARLRKGQMNFGPLSIHGARAGLAFLANAKERQHRSVELARAGIERVNAWVESIPGVEWSRPCGPGFGCVALPEGVDDVALAERLDRDCGVLIVPGSCFEMPGSFRLSWICAGDRLEQGLELLAKGIKEAQTKVFSG